MILTPQGWLELIPAAKLVEIEPDDETFVYFKDGERYRLLNAILVGVNTVRVDGEKANPGAHWKRGPKASLRVTATEVIPTIRSDQQEQP